MANVGRNDIGTIINDEAATPNKVMVYAEDGIIIATYNEDKTLVSVKFSGSVRANEEERKFSSEEKVFIWNSLNNMKPVILK